MAWYSRFAGFFTGVNAKVKAFFASPAGAVTRDAVAVILSRAGQLGIELLLSYAQVQVRRLEPLDLRGVEKKTDALRALKRFAAEQRLDVGASVLNWTLETAVQSIRSPQADAVPVPTP